MHKIVLFTIGALVILTSCSQFDDSSLIRFDYKRISDVSSINLVSRVVPEDISFSRISNYFRDSLLISFQESSSPYLVSVSDSRTDSLLGTFCPKGRSKDEPLMIIPVMDVFGEGESVKSLFFSYSNNTFFKWDVSGSMAAGKTMYDKVIPVKNEVDGALGALSSYYLPGDKIILQNARQTDSNWMVEPTTYEVYSAETGEREKLFSPFALYEGKEPTGDDGLFGSKVYLSLEDCIKPTRDKLVFAMRFIPYLGVLDINTGNVTGIRLANYPGLDPNHMYHHFIDVECDNDYIYALYAGCETISSPKYSEIFIFNWDSVLSGKVKVIGAHRLCLNGDMLYLLNYITRKAYRVDIDEIKSSL